MIVGAVLFCKTPSSGEMCIRSWDHDWKEVNRLADESHF
jgi:hypothetical protein